MITDGITKAVTIAHYRGFIFAVGQGQSTVYKFLAPGGGLVGSWNVGYDLQGIRADCNRKVLYLSSYYSNSVYEFNIVTSTSTRFPWNIELPTQVGIRLQGQQLIITKNTNHLSTIDRPAPLMAGCRVTETRSIQND
eukprot:PhF_6_TR26093/c0_g1_i1/m.36856